MNKTDIFNICLKTIKQNNKEIDEILSQKSNRKTSEEKNRSDFNRNKMKEFNRNARDLVKSISDMKNYLLQNRKDYINIYSPLLSLASLMTDRERDEIDEDVEQFIRICNEKAIKCLKDEVKRREKTQLSEHQNNAIDLIERYLKSVCDIHSQQKAIRIKRAVEKQRLLRLGNIVTNKSSENSSKLNSNPIELNPIEDEKEDKFSSHMRKTNDNKNKIQAKGNNQKKNVIVTTSDNTNEETYQQLELTKHELQAFEEENQNLYKEMNSLSDEVRDIEIKVIEIARLQEIFTDNVLKQEVDLNKLNDLTIASTENIRGGNQQLREAMKKNAGLRVWLLFFITTLAFTVLFLDWYND